MFRCAYIQHQKYKDRFIDWLIALQMERLIGRKIERTDEIRFDSIKLH